MTGKQRAVPLILQSGPQENAAAALAMILSFYGQPVDLNRLMEEGLHSAADILSAARTSGLYAEGHRVEARELERVPLPWIAHWRFREFLVVTRVKRGKIYVQSPAEGKFVLSAAEFAEGFTGIALCFAPHPNAEQKKESLPLTAFFRAFPSTTLLLGVAQVFSFVCCLSLTGLIRALTEQLDLGIGTGGLGLWLIGLLLAQAAALVFQMWLLRRCCLALEEQEKADLWDEWDGAALRPLQKTPFYRLAARYSSASAIPQATTQEAFLMLRLGMTVLYAAALAMQDIPAAAAGVVTAALFAAVCRAQRGMLAGVRQRAERDRIVLREQTEKHLSHIEQARMSGQNWAHLTQWFHAAAGAGRDRSQAVLEEMWWFFAAGEVLAVLCTCLVRMLGGHMGMPTLAASLYLSVMLALCMKAIPGLLVQRQTHRECMDIMEWKLPQKMFESDPAAAAPDALSLQNAAVRMAHGHGIIKGVTFQVRRGEILAVTGASDTLARAAAGREPLLQGELYLDREDAAQLGEEQVRAGVVLLEEKLPYPYGTVRENIAAGCGEITDYAIVQAASDALLHPVILRRRLGYDTPAASLSRGEQLLLVFANIFARGTPFVVSGAFTEPLDAETESGLLQAMRRREVGVVLLTEDVQLARQADLVCQIKDGRAAIQEHVELIDWEAHELV